MLRGCGDPCGASARSRSASSKLMRTDSNKTTDEDAEMNVTIRRPWDIPLAPLPWPECRLSGARSIASQHASARWFAPTNSTFGSRRHDWLCRVYTGGSVSPSPGATWHPMLHGAQKGTTATAADAEKASAAHLAPGGPKGAGRLVWSRRLVMPLLRRRVGCGGDADHTLVTDWGT